MRSTRWIIAAALALEMFGGCSSEPKDPFKETNAAQKYRDYVPPDAQTVASGKGTLTFTAPENGILHVVNTSSTVKIKGIEKPKVLGTGYLSKGMDVTFDPAAKRVYGKGREGVRLTDVDVNDTHELRFEPTTKPPKK
jgi:hypothetical protein